MRLVNTFFTISEQDNDLPEAAHHDAGALIPQIWLHGAIFAPHCPGAPQSA